MKREPFQAIHGARAFQASGHMYPRLFELGPITVYTYGVLLLRRTSSACSWRACGPGRAGSTRTASSTLASTSSSARSSARSCSCLVTDFGAFSANPRELLTLARSGGVFYGGLILAVAVALWVHPEDRPSAVDHLRRVRAGIALGHVIGRFGCLFAGCCYGRPTTLPWGITFRDPFAASNVGTPLGTPLHRRSSTKRAPSCSSWRTLLLTERKGKPFPGRTFWLYMLLYAISRFIIEFYRGERARMVGVFSTSQFHLAAPRADRDRDARVLVAGARPGTKAGASCA